MLTSFLVLAHMVKLGVTHTHIWAYRKLKGAEEHIIFIYIYSWKIRLERSFDKVLVKYSTLQSTSKKHVSTSEESAKQYSIV